MVTIYLHVPVYLQLQNEQKKLKQVIDTNAGHDHSFSSATGIELTK